MGRGRNIIEKDMKKDVSEKKRRQKIEKEKNERVAKEERYYERE